MLVSGYLLKESSYYRIAKTISDGELDHSIPLVLDYLAEGNANVVYKIVLFGLAAKCAIPPEVEGTVLRLSKQKNFVTSTQQRVLELRDTFSFIPKDYLVQQTLVRVDRNIVEAINQNLNLNERSGHRPRSRYGDLVNLEDNYGLLMTDMTATGTGTVLELKPKWLSQSPNAPVNAVRCRTCALRAQRQATKKGGQKTPEGNVYCPLALLSDDVDVRRFAAAAVLKTNRCDWISDGASQLANLFVTSGLLGLLRNHQIRLDAEGILELQSNKTDLSDFCIAMTLRDCTLFIRSRNGRLDSSCEMQLADLDLKAAHPDKVDKWIDTERSLINQGWYTNDETERQAETICVLSRN